jgi:hypothetical protein
MVVYQILMAACGMVKHVTIIDLYVSFDWSVLFASRYSVSSIQAVLPASCLQTPSNYIYCLIWDISFLTYIKQEVDWKLKEKRIWSKC